MKTIKTEIIPHKPTFVKIKNAKHELDHKAICVFTALGFFLDTDTYWLDQKVLPPATINTVDDEGFWLDSKPWFTWYYSPQKINLEQAVSQFSILFESIIEKQSKGKKVILPLSGGLDSRSQSVALKKIGADVKSYSYSFQNGYQESSISKKIAKACDFPFHEYVIPKSYLWDKIEELSNINQCYSEFTHPRQMAVIEEIATLGNSFSLGHWGDVLFDSDGYSEETTDQDLIKALKKKIIKKGGLELASSLWKEWRLEGSFEKYLEDRLLKLLSKIQIDNVNAKLRAFKSLYWAPRWTSVNLSIFESKHELKLPYYENEMCELICSFPEDLLANRQIQIEYIKQTNKKVASVLWQDAKPFNLFNYHLAKAPYNIPYRLFNKSKRLLQGAVGKKFVQRNWELQFLGEKNKSQLNEYVFSEKFNNWIDVDIVKNYLNLFEEKDQVYYSHSVSMLLTLAVFHQKNKS